MIKKNSFLEQEQHYEIKHDGTSAIGHDTDQHELTALDANQKAIEALQLLLRKLPNKLAVKDNLIPTIDDDNSIPDTKLTQPISQYNIPKDPNIYVPKFKPIKSSVTSTYRFQLGPIEEITKHTYGGNELGRKPDVIIENTVNEPHHSLHRHLVPPSIDSVSTTFKSHPSSSTLHAIEAQPLDLYHTMTRKNVEKISKPPQLSLPYLPPSSTHHRHQQIIPNAPKPHHLEIQKSIEYQLQ